MKHFPAVNYIHCRVTCWISSIICRDACMLLLATCCMTWNLLVFHCLFRILLIVRLIIIIIVEVFYLLCTAVQLSLCFIVNFQWVTISHLLAQFYVTVTALYFMNFFVYFVFIIKYIFVCTEAVGVWILVPIYRILCMCVLRAVLRIYCFCCCCRRRRGFILNWWQMYKRVC